MGRSRRSAAGGAVQQVATVEHRDREAAPHKAKHRLSDSTTRDGGNGDKHVCECTAARSTVAKTGSNPRVRGWMTQIYNVVHPHDRILLSLRKEKH